MLRHLAGLGGALFNRALLLAGVVSLALAAPQARHHQCPLASCQAEASGESSGALAFVELSQTSARRQPAALNVAVESETPDGDGDGTFAPQFRPAHFTCFSCDVSSCSNCSNIMCDTSRCLGEFYTQECWCGAGGGASQCIHVCDNACSTGTCAGNSCATRAAACRPWWACSTEPSPTFLQREQRVRQAGASLLRRLGASRRSHSAAEAESEEAEAGLEVSRRAQERLLAVRAKAKARSKDVSHKLSELALEDGIFVCDSAALPPKVQNPSTLLYEEAGYLIFDRRACRVEPFETSCYCWDNFKYLRGMDPKTSTFECDKGCKFGGCESKTCAMSAPPPLTSPPPPGEDPLVVEARESESLMNFGIRLSPDV